MKQVTPYLTFDGKTKEAFEYYKEMLGGEITEIQTFGEAQFETPPGMDDRVMHARFQNGDLLIMASDSFTKEPVKNGNAISLVLEFESSEEIKTIYDLLKEKGTVQMELQDTFWGAEYASVTDQFGINWQLNFTKE